MSKIQELKNDPANNINVVELFKGLFPQLKTKYIELLLKLSKENIKNSHFYKDIVNGNYEINKRIQLNEYEPYEAIFLTFLVNEFIRMDDLDTFLKFAEYNEKNQIENGDVTAIKDMDFINNEVYKVEIRTISKDMAKQIIKLHEDETWLVIKPLTVMASRKYGSNTKWCTTATSDYGYFHQYANNGNLIYVLNKKTGYKVALYKDLRERNKSSNVIAGTNGDLSFWNQKDQRIDSMEADLPMDVFLILAADAKECKVTNRQLLSEEERLKEAKLFPESAMKSDLVEAEEAPIGRNPIRVRDAEEDMQMDEAQDPQMEDEAPQDEIDVPRNGVPEVEEREEVAWSGPYVDRGGDVNENMEGLQGGEDMDFREELLNERVMTEVPYMSSKTISNDEGPQDQGTGGSL